jgi:hypothetical protein
MHDLEFVTTLTIFFRKLRGGEKFFSHLLKWGQPRCSSLALVCGSVSTIYKNTPSPFGLQVIDAVKEKKTK